LESCAVYTRQVTTAGGLCFEVPPESEMPRSCAPSQIGFEGGHADSQHVAFENVRDDGIDISWQRADGTGLVEQLVKVDAGSTPWPDAWSPISQNFLFSIDKPNRGTSLWTLSTQGKKSALFAESASRFVARSVFSPDGRWVAYQSNKTGQ